MPFAMIAQVSDVLVSGVFWAEKNSQKSFVAIGLRLVLIFCEVKKQAKNSNWH
jgi:hypothetical protein